jgi:mono/diheme cytochrome c family protein
MRRIALIIPFVVTMALLAFAERPARQQPPAVTFAEQVAPIVFHSCAPCHRPGEAAPFSLLTYEDVQRRGKLIASVTASRYMPPWHADSEMGSFRDDRRLTDTQIATIRAWVQAGMPAGDLQKMPQKPKFTPGWQLGTPDLVVRMDEAFEVPADGPDVFRNFAVKLNLSEDKWVKAIEFRPAANASHHALFFVDVTGKAVQLDAADPRPGFVGMNFLAGSLLGLGRGQRVAARGDRGAVGLGGWAVGGSPRELPEGLARPLPKDADLVLQMHFHPTGKIEREQATIGFYFADAPPKRRLAALQLPPLFGALAGIDIPAGEKRFFIKDSFTLPIDVEVIGAGAHAHYLAKDMQMVAVLPDGTKKDLMRIPDWDFNWQERYYFKEPLRLPKGTRLDVAIAYDNSSQNHNNPNSPPKRVTFGQQSTDEMGSMSIEIVAARERDLPEFAAAVQDHLQKSVANGLLNFSGRGRRQAR